MQLSANKAVIKNTNEARTPVVTVGIDEKEWEGFGEEGSGEQVDVSKSNGKVLARKDTPKSENKRGKQDEKQKKRAASQSTSSQNNFAALGTEDEGKDRADDEEGDGE